MELRGAVALVTGGNGGLGQRICHALAKQGVHIGVMYAQSRDQAEDVARGLASSHEIDAAAFGCDITDATAVSRVVGDFTARFGRLDILVNDAAYNVAIPFPDLDSMTMGVWDKIIATNLTGPMLLMKAVAPVVKTQGRGRIVNISSVAGLLPTGSSIAYAVSKAPHPPDALHGGGVDTRDIGQLRGPGSVGGHPHDGQFEARIYRARRGPVALKTACR
jgi:3-oxoacyl-[acyl-carrier protein] reductase